MKSSENPWVTVLIVIGATTFLSTLVGLGLFFGWKHVHAKNTFRPPVAATDPLRETASTDILLLPVGDFDYDYTVSMAQRLAQQTRLRIKPILSTPLDSVSPFPGTDQYDATRITTQLAPTIARLRAQYGPATVIVLTKLDINQPQRSTRFVFSFHDRASHISVISSARLVLGEGQWNAKPEIIDKRLMKFSLRCIGEQYFGLPRSNDINNVMYSPVMSLDDVDKIGTRFDIPVGTHKTR